MAFEWKTLLDVARLLEKEADQGPIHAEALRRSAVGRAYYAAFCHARNYAVQYLEIFPVEDTSHVSVLKLVSDSWVAPASSSDRE